MKKEIGIIATFLTVFMFASVITAKAQYECGPACGPADISHRPGTFVLTYNLRPGQGEAYANIDISSEGYAMEWRILGSGHMCFLDNLTSTNFKFHCWTDSYDYEHQLTLTVTYVPLFEAPCKLSNGLWIQEANTNGFFVTSGNYYSFNDGYIQQCLEGNMYIVEDCKSKGLAASSDFYGWNEWLMIHGFKFKPSCVAGFKLDNGVYVPVGGYVCLNNANLSRYDASGMTPNAWKCMWSSCDLDTNHCLTTDEAECEYATEYFVTNGTEPKKHVLEWGNTFSGEVKCLSRAENIGVYQCSGFGEWELVYECLTGECLTSSTCIAPIPAPPNPSPWVHFGWIGNAFNDFLFGLQSTVCLTFNVWC